MSKTPAAPLISKGILKLARQIDAALVPELVPVEPCKECVPGRSFDNVAAFVRWRGGSMQLGWSLREQPGVFAEGTCHAVWRCPERGLLDVTPRVDAREWTVFLPDSRIEWTGEVVAPRRMMLQQQPCYCGSGMPFNLCHALAEE